MSTKANLIFNAVLILIATLIGTTFPKVGSILGYVGGFVGLGLIYIIPIAVYLKRYKMNLENPRIVRALDQNLIKTVQNNGITSPKVMVQSSPMSPGLNRTLNSRYTSDHSMERTSLLSQDEVDPKNINYSGYYIQ